MPFLGAIPTASTARGDSGSSKQGKLDQWLGHHYGDTIRGRGIVSPSHTSTTSDEASQLDSSEYRTNVQHQQPQGIANWSGNEHPYYSIQERLDLAICMLGVVKRQKSGGRAKLQTQLGFIQKTANLLPLMGRIVGGPSRLAEVATRLRWSMEILQYAIENPRASLELRGPKEAARQAAENLQEAEELLAEIIVADEDARWPGCRNAEGELVLGGLK